MHDIKMFTFVIIDDYDCTLTWWNRLISWIYSSNIKGEVLINFRYDVTKYRDVIASRC